MKLDNYKTDGKIRTRYPDAKADFPPVDQEFFEEFAGRADENIAKKLSQQTGSFCKLAVVRRCPSCNHSVWLCTNTSHGDGRRSLAWTEGDFCWKCGTKISPFFNWFYRVKAVALWLFK